MNRLSQSPGPLASILLWLWLLSIAFAAGALGPTLQEILDRQPPEHIQAYISTLNP